VVTRPGSSIDALAPARRALLTRIKREGEARAEDLANALGITTSAVRQHLQSLERAGYVEHRVLRAGPGRPKHVFRLTEVGDALFPRRYGELAGELLRTLAEDDPDALDRAFERRRARRVERARARLAGLDLPDRVAELARILDEDGYVAEALDDPDGGWRIVEHNCAILDVAVRYGAACGTEIDFLREVLPDAEVDRTSHIVSGAHHCAYRIVPR
jgi:DeoR family suf operon transcriptional repressor